MNWQRMKCLTTHEACFVAKYKQVTYLSIELLLSCVVVASSEHCPVASGLSHKRLFVFSA